MNVTQGAALLRSARLPGVHTALVWPDGVEFCGSLNDQDDQADFIAGQFDPDAVGQLLAPLPVEKGTLP